MELTEEEQQKIAARLVTLKAQAVREAMVEVVGEQRAEILKRARAKLVAKGVPMEDSDVTETIP